VDQMSMHVFYCPALTVETDDLTSCEMIRHLLG